MSEVVNNKSIQKYLDEKFGSLELISNYIDSRKNITVKCKKCGSTFSKLFRYFKVVESTNICPGCNPLYAPRDNHGGLSWDEESIKERIKDETGDTYELLEEFKTTNVPIKIRHKTCGHEYSVKLQNFFQGKRCPVCGKVKKKNVNDIQAYLDNNYPNQFKVKGKYVSKDVPIEIEHLKCHNTLNLTWNNIREGRFGCKHCKMSLGELVISGILEKHSVEYEYDVRFEECKDKSYLPFDFVIDKDEEIFIIECDGRQHRLPIFHGDHGNEEMLKMYKKHDKIKDKFCKKYGVHLLRIPFEENHNTKEIERQIVEFLDL